MDHALGAPAGESSPLQVAFQPSVVGRPGVFEPGARLKRSCWAHRTLDLPGRNGNQVLQVPVPQL